jgi:hypothetical protein
VILTPPQFNLPGEKGLDVVAQGAAICLSEGLDCGGGLFRERDGNGPIVWISGWVCHGGGLCFLVSGFWFLVSGFWFLVSGFTFGIVFRG